MNYRFARLEDCPLLAALNAQLIQDEGHRNPMTVDELQARMKGWLEGEYTAVLFEATGETVAYALYRHDSDSIYLRQLFVTRTRRRTGVGRQAMELLFNQIWPADARITLEVLTGNTAAHVFWEAMGFKDYAVIMERFGTSAG